MRLALNYSPQAAALLAENRIDFDLFKCPMRSEAVVQKYDPDLIEKARVCRPIYIHFPLHAGNDSRPSIDWKEIETILAETETPYVNIHLHAHTNSFAGMPADTTDPAHIRQVTDRFIRDVSILTERFRPDRVIAENVVYHGAGGDCLYPSVDPAVISEVVRETGCGLLLDTAHARLTARELGIDVKDYISRLPVSRLRELHVTGAQSDGKRMRDSMPMGQEDWELIGWVMEQISAGQWLALWAVAFEYGGVGPAFDWRSDPDVLAEQVPRLREMIHAL